MKKLFFIAGIALSLSAAAQTEKGSWMVGANFTDLNFKFAENTNLMSFTLNPNLAYFISDNFAIGGQVGFGIAAAKKQDPLFTYNVQPLARYYFMKEQKSGIFGQATVGIDGYSQSEKSQTGLTFSVGAGWNYWLNKSVALEVGAHYINRDKKVDLFQNSVNVNFGLQIFLPKKTASDAKSSYRKK